MDGSTEVVSGGCDVRMEAKVGEMVLENVAEWCLRDVCLLHSSTFCRSYFSIIWVQIIY